MNSTDVFFYITSACRDQGRVIEGLSIERRTAPPAYPGASSNPDVLRIMIYGPDVAGGAKDETIALHFDGGLYYAARTCEDTTEAPVNLIHDIMNEQVAGQYAIGLELSTAIELCMRTEPTDLDLLYRRVIRHAIHFASRDHDMVDVETLAHAQVQSVIGDRKHGAASVFDLRIAWAKAYAHSCDRSVRHRQHPDDKDKSTVCERSKIGDVIVSGEDYRSEIDCTDCISIERGYNR